MAVWSDPRVTWRGAALTLIRSTWDYPHHLEAFLAWVDATSRVTALHNPPDLVRGNIDKRYLRTLSERGVAVVPTRWVERPDAHTLERVRHETGWDDLVVKPAVGCDGEGVVRVPPHRQGIRPPKRDSSWLVQPFLPSILTDGEVSVVVIDGEPAYAAVKHPASNGADPRVQERWGGTSGPTPLTPATAASARQAIQAIGAPRPPLYARVDLIGHEGRWHVIEVELIEPSLYLFDDASRVDALDLAIRRRLRLT